MFALSIIPKELDPGFRFAYLTGGPMGPCTPANAMLSGINPTSSPPPISPTGAPPADSAGQLSHVTRQKSGKPLASNG